MAAKKPDPEVAPEPTEEERLARIAAAEEKHRNRRPRHTPSNPLTYDVSACPPCGPPGGYEITNRVAAANTIRQASDADNEET